MGSEARAEAAATERRRAWWEREVDGLEFRLATDTDDFDAAFTLVHDQYVGKGYMERRRSGRRISIFNALPTTKVFVARRSSTVVGTVTLVQESPLGLPMDEIYREELRPLRRAGQRLGEVSALAVSAEEGALGLAIVMRLVRMLIVYAADVAGLDALCIAVNPRHVEFYAKVCSFVHFAPSRAYGKVNGAPAVGMMLDLNLTGVRAGVEGSAGDRRLREFMFWPSIRSQVRAVLCRDLPWSVMTSRQFVHFFSDDEVLKGAQPEALQLLGSLYGRLAAGDHRRNIDLSAGRPAMTSSTTPSPSVPTGNRSARSGVRPGEYRRRDDR